MSTQLFNRSDVARLVDPGTLFASMQSAFIDYSTNREIPARRFFSNLPGPGEAMVLMPGLAREIPAYTVKVNAKFEGQEPAIRGAVLLNDIETGALLAVLDSFEVTAIRTGLSAAMATDKLARSDATKVAVIGAGVQGVYQLGYLEMLRKLDSVKVYDVSLQRAKAYVTRMRAEMDTEFEVCRTLATAVEEVDIVLMATWAKQPVLFSEMVPVGCHVTTLGADGPGEAEVDAELIKNNLFVCDDRDLAIEMGAVGGVGMGTEVIDAELGEVLAGQHPGRINLEQITVYGAVGLAFQDLVTAWQVYCSASDDKQQNYDFLA
ncbi:MAG: ornithine cyclodeaminase family protein [Arenicellales bacterium]